MIKLSNITKTFDFRGQNLEVLKDINLEVKKGETLSIVGPSGSGKTTLLSLISGLDQATSGEIVIAGRSIGDMTEAELTQFRGEEIGIIFQTFHLINYMTAKENIEVVYNLKGQKIDAISLLEQVGLSERANHFPYNLSGGECQRLAIARALAGRPSLIIADEPSGNLDRETGKKVMDLLFSLVEKEQATLILVTHDLDLAKRTKRQAYIEGGKLYAD